MVEVNGAYKHGKYEKLWLKSLCVMSTVKAMQDSQLNSTHYLDQYDTHMAKKKRSHTPHPPSKKKKLTKYDEPQRSSWECMCSESSYWCVLAALN